MPRLLWLAEYQAFGREAVSRQATCDGLLVAEEVLAGVAKQVPYNSQEEMKKRGAIYEKNLLPFTSKVNVDVRLVTGQNPQSAKATAKQVAALLSKN